MPGEDPLLRLRPEFPILEKATYRIANSLGAMPRVAARALAEYAETWATRGVRAGRLRQTARAIALAERRGLRSARQADPARRRDTASVDLPNALEVPRELNARDVVVDDRPGVGIRMSPHFHTEDRELDSAFEEIDEILETGAWKRWEGRGGLVT